MINIPGEYVRYPEILAIEGIDGIFIGPNDLGTSLGKPDDYENPEYWEVVDGIIAKSEASGRPVMIHQQNIPDSARAIEAGARFILHCSDSRLLQRQMQSDFTALRKVAEGKLGRSLAMEVEDTVETV